MSDSLAWQRSQRSPTVRTRALDPLRSVVLLSLLAFPALARADDLTVIFRLNDAFVKDRMLGEVKVEVRGAQGGEAVASGTTDSEGLLRFDLPVGDYSASFSRRLYIPLETDFTLDRDGQIITTTLSMMLEAEGSSGENRIRIILNWGADESSQVRDVDSHLLCTCDEAAHVYFSQREHAGENHGVDLDVDDMDWGGPETITLRDPPPGRYLYWLHDYSAGPGSLASSEIVVRVLFGDRLAGEFRPPIDVVELYWRPFEAIEVGPTLEAKIVPFVAGTESDALIRRAPEAYETEGGEAGMGAVSVILGVVLFLAALLVLKVVRSLRR